MQLRYTDKACRLLLSHSQCNALRRLSFTWSHFDIRFYLSVIMSLSCSHFVSLYVVESTNWFTNWLSAWLTEQFQGRPTTLLFSWYSTSKRNTPALSGTILGISSSPDTINLQRHHAKLGYITSNNNSLESPSCQPIISDGINIWMQRQCILVRW